MNAYPILNQQPILLPHTIPGAYSVLCTYIHEKGSRCEFPEYKSGYCSIHYKSLDIQCKGFRKNGSQCKYKSVYKGLCRTHGKHIMEDEKDPFEIIKTGNYQLVKDRITQNKLDVNYVSKDGKTVIHRLFSDMSIRGIHNYCALLAKNGLDMNKTSVDTFTVDGVTYIDTEISPLVYLIFVSGLYHSRTVCTIVRALSGHIKNLNFDLSLNGEHILSRILKNYKLYEILIEAVKHTPGNVLTSIKAYTGNNIIHHCIEEYIRWGQLTSKGYNILTALFSNKALANDKDKKGEISCVSLLNKLVKYYDYVPDNFKSMEDFMGASDLSIANNEGICTLQMPVYKKLCIKDVYSYIQDAREGTGNGNAIRSVLDSIFVFKMIAKRWKYALCKLVETKIINYLLSMYE